MVSCENNELERITVGPRHGGRRADWQYYRPTYKLAYGFVDQFVAISSIRVGCVPLLKSRSSCNPVNKIGIFAAEIIFLFYLVKLSEDVSNDRKKARDFLYLGVC